MNCEVVAVGTELLLGQIVDTNSSWIGEQLALAGIDSHHQTKVGDNLSRMVAVLSQALDRSDAVICCGGLGPTQDDITRDAIAAVMGVELARHAEAAERIRRFFADLGRPMSENNLRQADVPVGAALIPVMPGTAPGLVCPVDAKVVYAVPGVPWEMQRMVSEYVLPDLKRRAGITAVIGSRVLRTWGESESGLAERLHDEIERLDADGTATLAFLASGWEGLKVRITAKADSPEALAAVLDGQETRLRAILGDDLIFGVDDETMESSVLDLCRSQGLRLATAESLTGGLIGARLTAVPGASDVFAGSVVAYSPDVKHRVLSVPDVPVVSEEAVVAMARGVTEVLDADCAVAVTGVAGPDPVDGVDVGTVWLASLVDGEVTAHRVSFPTDRERVRQFTTISALSDLRARLLARAGALG